MSQHCGSYSCLTEPQFCIAKTAASYLLNAISEVQQQSECKSFIVVCMP